MSQDNFKSRLCESWGVKWSDENKHEVTCRLVVFSGASLQFRFTVYKISKKNLERTRTTLKLAYDTIWDTYHFQLFQKEGHLPTPDFSGTETIRHTQRCPSSTGPEAEEAAENARAFAHKVAEATGPTKTQGAGDHFLRVFGKLKTPEIERGIDSEFRDSIFQYFKQVGAPKSVRKLQGPKGRCIFCRKGP